VSATSVILRGRAAAERLMLDACTVRRLASEATNRETGVVIPTYTTVYSGKCKFQQRATGSSQQDLGQATIMLVQLEVHLPASVTGVLSEDIVTCTASVLDAELVGRTWLVQGEAHKSYLSARRLVLQELTS
jgi:hypothetical protein